MNPKTFDYQKQQRYQENEILEHAAEILAKRYEREVFAVMMLDNQNRLIEFVSSLQG